MVIQGECLSSADLQAHLQVVHNLDNHDGNLLFQEYTENRHLQLSSASSNLLADLQPASIDIRYIP